MFIETYGVYKNNIIIFRSKHNFILKGEENFNLDRPQLYYPCDTANAKETNHLKILYWYVLVLCKNVTSCCMFRHKNLQQK